MGSAHLGIGDGGATGGGEERGGGEGLEEAMWKVERGVLRENRHHEVWRWRPKSKIFLTIMLSLQLRPTMSSRDNNSYMEE